MDIGDVHQDDRRGRFRIVGFDNRLVFYDVPSAFHAGWSMERRRSFSYFRHERTYVDRCTEFVDCHPLSEAEWNLHRPDLPSGIAQFPSTDWLEETFDDVTRYAARLSQSSYFDESELGSALEVAKVALVAYGPRGGTHKPKVIEALDGERFGTLELLWRANNYCADLSTNMERGAGVGIYRVGVRTRLPLYCVGERYDLYEMNMLRKYGRLSYLESQ